MRNDKAISLVTSLSEQKRDCHAFTSFRLAMTEKNRVLKFVGVENQGKSTLALHF